MLNHKLPLAFWLSVATVSAHAYDINAYCRSLGEATDMGARFELTCRRIEAESKQMVAKITVPAKVMKHCDLIAKVGGLGGSYSMLEKCIEMELEALGQLQSRDGGESRHYTRESPQCQCPKGRPLDAPLNRVVSAYVGHAEFLDTNVVAIEGKPLQLYGVTPNGSDKRSVTRAMNDKIRGRQVSCEIRDRNIYGDLMVVCLVGKFDLNSWMVFEGFVDAGITK